MIFRRFPAEGSRNLAYLIGDENSGEAAIIDPSGLVAEITKALEDEGLELKYIINTHSHPDHTGGNRELAANTGAKVLRFGATGSDAASALGDGAVIRLNSTKIKVIHTPGHTPDSICLLVDNKLFTGDTLFVGECGRTDMPGGNSGSLYDSLFGKIMTLDDELEVYPGHDYGAKPESTLGFEKEHNYTLKPRTREEFIRFMRE